MKNTEKPESCFMSLRRGAWCHSCSQSRRAATHKAGFTLVEISMVLLLFASAVGGLLSFFPVGLRMESNAISDSAQSMFALDILGQIEANANAITDWNIWNDNTDFYTAALKNVKVNDGRASVTTNFKRFQVSADGKAEDIYRSDDEGTLVDRFLTDRANIRYIVQFSHVESPIYYGKSTPRGYKLRRVTVWVTDRRDGDPFMNTPFTLYLTFCPPVNSIIEGGTI